MKNIALALALATVAAPVAAQDGGAVRVRAGEHPGFNRLVFDFPAPTDYRVEQDGDAVRIVFTKAVSLDLAPARRIAPPMIRELRAEPTALAFNVPVDAKLRYFRDGGRVIVDVLAPPDGSSPVAGARTTPAEVSPRPAPAPRERAAAPAATPAPEPAAGPTPLLRERPAAAPRPQPAAASASPAPAAPAPAPVAADVPAALPVETMTPIVQSAPGRRVVVFPWTQPVAAAAWERHGRFYVLFDAPVNVDLRAVLQFGAAQQLPLPNATLVSLPSQEGGQPVLERRGHAWQVNLAAAEAVGPVMRVERDLAVTAPRVLVTPAIGANVISLRDPETGANLVVAALREPGRLPEGAEYPEFSLAPSRQGVVVVPRADGLLVADAGRAVAIGAAEGLILSNSRGGPAGVSNVNRPLLLRFGAWASEPGENRTARRQDLQAAIAVAPPATRNAARRELAQHHAGAGEDAEALGVLARMVRDDILLERDPAFRLLRGVMALRVGREAAAEADLRHASLESDPEAALWRGLLAARRDDHAAARDEFARAGAAAAGYPADLQADFQLASARAHLAGKDVPAAEAVLRGVDKARLDAGQAGDLALLQGEIAIAKGDTRAAESGLAKLRQGNDRRLKVLAELATVDAGLAAKKISPADAAERLDALRYSWRGDATELRVLRRLGQVRFDAGDWRGGFEAMKQALAYFPRSPQRAEIAQEMSAAFERLFTGPESEQLPPHIALALFEEFKELTPSGRAGDMIVRRLADRLGSVDLLERAAALLEPVATRRLDGVDRVEAGARLALYRLLDRKPDEALRALEATAGAAPAHVVTERRIIAARALAAQRKPQEALAALADETGPEAEATRADLYWQAQDWRRTADTLGAMLAAQAGGARPLEPADRRRVLQMAIAVSLSGDGARLGQLRDRWSQRLAGTPEEEAFRLATARTGTDETRTRHLAGAIAQVGQLEAFMASYRARLARPAATAVN